MSQITDPNKAFWAEISLSSADAGLYSAIRQAKSLSNDQIVLGMVLFCLQLLVSELPTLSAGQPITADLERAMNAAGESLRQIGSLLSGAEKILLDAAALREHLSRSQPHRP